MQNSKSIWSVRVVPAFIVLLLVITLLSACTSTEERQSPTSIMDKDSESLTIQLLSWPPLATSESNLNNPLAHRIKQFQDLHPNVHITFLWNDTYGTPSKWMNNAEAYKHADSNEVPDLVELAPMQMRLWYLYGIIEPLLMNETALSKYLIISNDGHVLGVKTKINPLIV